VLAPNLANATDQVATIGSAITNIMSVMAESVVAIWSAPVVFVRLGAGAFTVKEKLALSVLSVAFFAVTVYTVRTISGTPTKMRALNIYTVTAKDAKDNTGSASFSLTVNVLAPNLANATDQVATIGLQLTIAPPELLKVMSVMAESVVAIWSAPVVFVRLGAGAFTVKEKTALSVLSVAFFAVTVYTVRALTSVGVPLMVQVALSILKPAGSLILRMQQTK
jgi:uncharacterized membrane protein (DUF2068 family)